MTTEHDFAMAEIGLNDCQKNSEAEFITPRMYKTIRFALRLADKLLKREPSEGMIDAGECEERKCYPVEDMFKSMLTTAVKEIEND